MAEFENSLKSGRLCQAIVLLAGLHFRARNQPFFTALYVISSAGLPVRDFQAKNSSA